MSVAYDAKNWTAGRHSIFMDWFFISSETPFQPNWRVIWHAQRIARASSLQSKRCSPIFHATFLVSSRLSCPKFSNRNKSIEGCFRYRLETWKSCREKASGMRRMSSLGLPTSISIQINDCWMTIQPRFRSIIVGSDDHPISIQINDCKMTTDPISVQINYCKMTIHAFSKWSIMHCKFKKVADLP